MKAILFIFALIFSAVCVSAYEFDGEYWDNRFQGVAYIASEDHDGNSNDNWNNGLQGTASGKVIFWSDDYDTTDGHISGSYAESGPIPRTGSFELWTSDDGQTLSGWYYPDDDKYSGWPWVLSRLSDAQPTHLQALYLNNATDTPDINGKWNGPFAGDAEFCNDDEGVLALSRAGGAYVTGKTNDDYTWLVGRSYQGAFPADDKVKPSVYCQGVDSLNFLVKIITDDENNFILAGFVNWMNIYSPNPVDQLVFYPVSSDENTHCASDNYAYKLANCESGEVGGPISKPFRGSAAGLFVSFSAVIVAACVFLF